MSNGPQWQHAAASPRGACGLSAGSPRGESAGCFSGVLLCHGPTVRPRESGGISNPAVAIHTA